MDKLENIIESLLFLSGNAIEIKDIAEKLNINKKEIEQAVESLKEKYNGVSGIHILSFNKKIQFSSNPDYAPMVDSVLNPIKERELSKAMLEIASIIAYKQPVTRLDIEEVRGVNSDYAISVLLKHNIIEVTGRKNSIGKPLLYGTTDEFLKRFNLSSLNDLPDYEDVLSRIKVLQPENTNDLYYHDKFDDNNDNSEIENNDNIENGNDIKNNINIDNDLKQNFNNEELPDFLKNEKNLKIING